MNAGLLRILQLLGLLILPLSSFGFDFGPLIDDFPLTLAPGSRLEAAGPLFYDQQSESQHTWAVPPLLSTTSDPVLEYREIDFLYPLMTYDRFGDQYRWQFLQLLSFAGGSTQTETNRDRFTLFPIFFRQHSSDTNENYWGFLPFYGNVKHRLFRDEVYWVMFPAYLKSRNKDVYTWNYLFPFIHVRRGDNLRGWQFWPVVGHQEKGLTYQTNGFGDVTTIGGHDRWFALWPIYFNERNDTGTTNASRTHGVLPLYSVFRSPLRDSTSVLWPFFNWIDEREKKYHEWQGPWPFVDFARGEGKTLNRVLPFYSHGITTNYESWSYAWPIYRENHFRSAPADRRRSTVLFFLFSDVNDKNTETGKYRTRTDLWPIFTHKRDFDGSTRLQVLALLEPILANNKSIERNYSPLWSLWRDERNPVAGASSQSLLWNLYRHESSPSVKKTSLLFGAFRYVKDSGGKHLRLFYIPLGSSPVESKASGQPKPGGAG